MGRQTITRRSRFKGLCVQLIWKRKVFRTRRSKGLEVKLETGDNLVLFWPQDQRCATGFIK